MMDSMVRMITGWSENG